MGYIALKHLKWGKGFISPGEAVPEDEQGRNYASLLRTGRIERVADAPKPKAVRKPKPKAAEETKPEAEVAEKSSGE